MKNIIRYFKVLINKLEKNHIGEYAASSAFFTLLSFIPLMMLILTLTKYIGIEESSLFFIINQITPSNNDEIIGIIREIYSKSVGTITISAIFALWSAGKGFLALCKGLDIAYEVKQKKRFMYRIKATICTIIFILLITSTLVLLVFGDHINIFLQEKFNIFSKLFNAIVKSKVFICIVILFIVFANLYKFIPKHKYKLKYQIPGAIFATVSYIAVSMFYSKYVSLFKGFSVLYGSLTTIALAMMWLYACMYSILVGATLNKMIAEKNIKKE